MPKKLSELICENSFNVLEEYERIEALISQIPVVCEMNFLGIRRNTVPTLPFETILDSFFTEWNLRDTYISVADMRSGLGITVKDFSIEFRQEKFLVFLQYVLNACLYVANLLDEGRVSRGCISDEKHLNTIIKNINSVLEKLNYTWSRDEETNEIYIVEKNSTTTAVSELYPDISLKVIEYKRYVLQGNLERKAEILCTLWKKYEAVREIIRSNNLSTLDGFIGCLYNDVIIRHNNIEGKKPNIFVQGMSLDELETWYDKAYDLFLLSLLHVNYIENKNELDEFKKKVDDGKKGIL